MKKIVNKYINWMSSRGGIKSVFTSLHFHLSIIFVMWLSVLIKVNLIDSDIKEIEVLIAPPKTDQIQSEYVSDTHISEQMDLYKKMESRHTESLKKDREREKNKLMEVNAQKEKAERELKDQIKKIEAAKKELKELKKLEDKKKEFLKKKKADADRKAKEQKQSASKKLEKIKPQPTLESKNDKVRELAILRGNYESSIHSLFDSNWVLPFRRERVKCSVRIQVNRSGYVTGFNFVSRCPVGYKRTITMSINSVGKLPVAKDEIYNPFEIINFIDNLD